MGTDWKFSHVSLRTNQILQETFRLSPSFQLAVGSAFIPGSPIRLRPCLMQAVGHSSPVLSYLLTAHYSLLTCFLWIW